MPVQPTSAARQRRCSGRGVFNSPTPNTGAACLDRGAQARRAPTVPVGLSPGRGGGAGWRAAGTASAPFVTSEQLSLRHRLQQATRRARQRHSANDDASRPRGRRLPFAHPSSPSTDRARKRASFIFVPTRPPVCCSSGGAAQRRPSLARQRVRPRENSRLLLLWFRRQRAHATYRLPMPPRYAEWSPRSKPLAAC